MISCFFWSDKETHKVDALMIKSEFLIMQKVDKCGEPRELVKVMVINLAFSNVGLSCVSKFSHAAFDFLELDNNASRL